MKKILIIDDNEKNIKLASEALTHYGYKILEAGNGKDAIEAAKKEKPDLVLMDIQMPDMNGIEIMKEIKKIKDLQNTPIVAFTAYAMKGDMETFMSKGFDAYLPKPVQVKILIDTVTRLID